MKLPARLIIVPVVAVLGFGVWATSDYQRSASGADELRVGGAKAVEESMHEFMEYVFQPAYKRLKVQMAKEPESNTGWKAIKSDALILSESCNLLLDRAPKDAAADWKAIAISVREAGGQFYQAARKKDFSSTSKRYAAMLTKCNSCHKQFADGKYQLKP